MKELLLIIFIIIIFIIIFLYPLKQNYEIYKQKRVVILGILVFIIIPIIVDYVVIGDTLIKTNQSNAQWSSFLGSYLGCGIGGFITLFGVYWQTTRQEKQKEKEEIRNFLLGLKYNLEENINNADIFYKIVQVFSYTIRIFNDNIDDKFLTDLTDNGVFLGTKVFNLNFANDILKLNKKIFDYNKNTIFLIKNLNERSTILQKYKGEDENIKNNIENIIFLSQVAFNFSCGEKLKLSMGEKEKLKIIDETLYNAFYDIKKIYLEEEKSNLLKNNKYIQAFQLMNVLCRESINLFEQLKEGKNYEEYIELRKKIFNFLKSDKELINLDIYKLLEEMVTLKEKIVIELQKYN